MCILDCFAGVEREHGRRLAWGLTGFILLEGLLFGGLGLRPPTTDLPTVDCEIPGNGGVLTWPEDRKDGELGLSRLLQMSHGHATPQMGIASWKQADQTAMYDIRGANFHFPLEAGMSKNCMVLVLLMYWLPSGTPFFIRPDRYQPCGEYDLIELQPLGLVEDHLGGPFSTWGPFGGPCPSVGLVHCQDFVDHWEVHPSWVVLVW